MFYSPKKAKPVKSGDAKPRVLVRETLKAERIAGPPKR
jgi:hypothetical protein